MPYNTRPSTAAPVLLCCLSTLGPLAPVAAAAEPPSTAVTLDAVEVTQPQRRAPANQPAAGATNRIELASLPGAAVLGSADVLARQPGVHAQSPGNEGHKVSIRGSGINRGPGAHASGLSVSLDGLPLTGPGGTPYELLEPTWLRRVDVWRGANGFERGALALGGAIDYTTVSGRDAPGASVRLEAGSRGYRKQALQLGGQTPTTDYLLAYARHSYDGYQRHAASEADGIMANLGWQPSSNVQTRFHLRYRQTEHQTPGRLTAAQIADDPRQANPANLAIDAHRPQPGSLWLGNMTRVQLAAATALNVGVVYHRYPMDLNESLYRQQLDYSNLNGVFELQHGHALWGRQSDTTVALRVTHDLDADVRESLRFASNGYPAGTQTRRFSHHGTDTTLTVANRLALAPQIWLHSGVAVLHSDRDVQVTSPIVQPRLQRSRWDLAPRLGMTWQATPDTQWFGNLSRTLEPAHPWSMIWGSSQYFPADAGPAAGRQRLAVPLQHQRASTLELGARGNHRLGNWEMTGYYAQVRNELLSVERQPAPNQIIAEANASPTVHRGIEAGLDSTLWRGRSGTLQLQQAYTFSDFRYRNDARWGHNPLPGLPRHYYQAQLRYAHAGGGHVALTTEHGSSMAVDYANSVRVRGHTVVGMLAGYSAPSGRWQGWLELRNLGDRRYAATVTPGDNDMGRDMARSTPGEGRAVYAGMSLHFR